MVGAATKSPAAAASPPHGVLPAPAACTARCGLFPGASSGACRPPRSATACPALEPAAALLRAQWPLIASPADPRTTRWVTAAARSVQAPPATGRWRGRCLPGPAGPRTWPQTVWLYAPSALPPPPPASALAAAPPARRPPTPPPGSRPCAQPPTKMANLPQLTQGAIARLVAGETGPPVVLQCLGACRACAARRPSAAAPPPPQPTLPAAVPRPAPAPQASSGCRMRRRSRTATACC